MFAFIGFSVRRGWRGFWGNGLTSLAATATTVLMLLLLSGVLILLTGLNSTLDYVQQEAPVVALLKESATQGEIDALQASLKAMPQVSRVTFVSQDEAYRDWIARYPDTADVINSSPDNPRPFARLQVYLRDPKDNLAVAAFVKSQPTVYAPINNQQTVDQMITLIGVFRVGGAVILIVVGLIVLFIIVNTIRLAVVARSDEIEIMRLVGASDAFIRWPFIFEGVLLGLIGAAITIGVLFLAQGPIAGFLSQYFEVLPVAASATAGRDIALMVLGAGVGIGAVGSYISVRSFLIR
jgi:cell division transport system permease protein